MSPATQIERIKAFDWAVSVPIEGNRNAVDKARRVLIYWLVQRGGYFNGRINAMQGPSKISRDLGVPIATVNRAIKKLEVQGIISKSCYGVRRIYVGGRKK